MIPRRIRERLVLTTCLALACAGCSWLIGVSEDPIVPPDVVDAAMGPRDGTTPDVADAADASVDAQDEPPEDAEADAPEDAEEEL